MRTRPALVRFLVILASCSCALVVAQQKPATKAPPPPPPPPPKPAAPPPKPAAPQANPLGAVGETLKHDAVETAISTVLDNQLPLKLDATVVYPTVNVLPGGPFRPKPLQLTAADLNKPLPPGDYTINTLAFCTEYSVHRPGAGVSYVLGPMQGKAAGAIGALLWRGTIEKGRPPQQLQAVSWAIQSGVTYSQMPKTYQAVIDDVIPDHKNELNGDFIQSLEGVYQNYAKTMKLPPLEQQLAKMGKPGELALSAKRQREALLRQNTTDQIREQTLFQGQESSVYTPVRAEEGPWTERIPGRMYMRLQIVGGNMATNNAMQIRVLPVPHPVARYKPPLLLANFSPTASASPQGGRDACFFTPQAAGCSPLTDLANLWNAFLNLIGYSQGRGAQALGQVPMVAGAGKPPATPVQKANAPVGTTLEVEGTATLKHPNGTTEPLTVNSKISMGDTIETGLGSRAFILFVDNTEFTLSEKTRLTVDNYVFDSNDSASNKARYALLEGAFQYVSGLIGKKENPDVKIETPYGGIGIRGTKFIATLHATSGNVELNLIEGTLAIAPKGISRETLFNAPAKISLNTAGAKGASLTEAQYDALKTSLFSSGSPGAARPSTNSTLPVL